VGGYFLLRPSSSDSAATVKTPTPPGNFSPGVVKLP
jgi:hypothetical protein